MRNHKHRRPPLPDSMKRPASKGVCRWCGEAILKSDGTPAGITWHRECVKVYRIACFSSDQREAVFRRDDGICASCGVDTLDGLRKPHPHHAYHRYKRMGQLWQADHIRSLAEANGDISFYFLSNLQTLCTACHNAKTRRDMRRLRDSRKPTRQLEFV